MNYCPYNRNRQGKNKVFLKCSCYKTTGCEVTGAYEDEKIVHTRAKHHNHLPDKGKWLDIIQYFFISVYSDISERMLTLSFQMTVLTFCTLIRSQQSHVQSNRWEYSVAHVQIVFLLSNSYMGIIVILVHIRIFKCPNSSCLNY